MRLETSNLSKLHSNNRSKIDKSIVINLHYCAEIWWLLKSGTGRDGTRPSRVAKTRDPVAGRDANRQCRDT